MKIDWQKTVALPSDASNPSGSVMKDGGLAIVATSIELNLHLHFLDPDGELYWSSPSFAQALPGAWNIKPYVATLSNGNIVAFARDTVLASYNYDFKGRFVFAVFSPDGDLVTSGDLRLPLPMSQSLRYRPEDDGTLSIVSDPTPDTATPNPTGMQITGIGSPSSLNVEMSAIPLPSPEEGWLLTPSNIGGSTRALNEQGPGYAIDPFYLGGTTMSTVVTKQNNLVGDAPYYGAFSDEEISDILSSPRIIGGTDGNDVFDTTPFDYFLVDKPAPFLDGGDGIDTIQVRAQREDEWFPNNKLARDDDGRIFLSTNASSYAEIGMINIERIEFIGFRWVESDTNPPYAGYSENFSAGTLALDIDGNAGQAYRLYQAAFDRVPDNEGLIYWIDRLDSGNLSLRTVAESFIYSQEFILTYGAPEAVSNSDYISLLYLHTLGRDYDEGGYNYWVEELDKHHMSRSDILISFSESDENVARTSDVIGDGIWLF